MNPTDIRLIGVDGGATQVRARVVAPPDPFRSTSFSTPGPLVSRNYPDQRGFVPVPIDRQVADGSSGAIRPTPEECEAARRWVQTAADVIAEAAAAVPGQTLLIGIGMPGRKTPDGRGIAVLRNGPRIPDYLDQLEQALAARSVRHANPIAALGSDADHCGLGEQYHDTGLFRGVNHAYYLGCGTGLADALKLGGQVVSMDDAGAWLAKSWAMNSALGPSFEELVSARAIQDVHRRLDTGRRWTDSENQRDLCPEAAAAAGNPTARAWLNTVGLVLAELFFERLWTVKNGRTEAPHRSTHYLALRRDHPHRGVILQRLILGQRIGQLCADPAMRLWIMGPIEAALAARIADCDDEDLRTACLSDPAASPATAVLRPGLLASSGLRSAGVVGAAVAAYRAAMPERFLELTQTLGNMP